MYQLASVFGVKSTKGGENKSRFACARKYVEETFLPAAKGAFAIRAKKEVVRFPAA
jgi:hypothetical protein